MIHLDIYLFLPDIPEFHDMKHITRGNVEYASLRDWFMNLREFKAPDHYPKNDSDLCKDGTLFVKELNNIELKKMHLKNIINNDENDWKLSRVLEDFDGDIDEDI
eukprot:781070-Ditylum_brightwellii.AAC.1